MPFSLLRESCGRQQAAAADTAGLQRESQHTSDLAKQACIQFKVWSSSALSMWVLLSDLAEYLLNKITVLTNTLRCHLFFSSSSPGREKVNEHHFNHRNIHKGQKLSQSCGRCLLGKQFRAKHLSEISASKHFQSRKKKVGRLVLGDWISSWFLRVQLGPRFSRAVLSDLLKLPAASASFKFLTSTLTPHRNIWCLFIPFASFC